MADPARTRQRMTVDEFLAWEAEDDTRYELVDGEIRAMAPTRRPHGTIQGNAFVLLRAKLHAPCVPVIEAGVTIGEHDFLVSDVGVACEPDDERGYGRGWSLVVEVLSPSNRGKEMAGKVAQYIDLPSMREVWVIDGEKRWVRTWQRREDVWVLTFPVTSGSFRSPFLDADVPLDEIYAGSGL